MIKRLYKSVIPASRLHFTVRALAEARRTLRVKVLAGRFPLSAGRASRIPLVRTASDRSALRLLAKDHASFSQEGNCAFRFRTAPRLPRALDSLVRVSRRVRKVAEEAADLSFRHQGHLVNTVTKIV